MGVIREAEAADADRISALIAQLGFSATPREVEGRMEDLAMRGEPVLVADEDGVAGCITWHVTPALHRPTPVGRITMLVVAEDRRGSGLGRELVGAVEQRLVGLGCALVEVTSNLRLVEAHRFYEHLGFERTSHRFGKSLAR